MNTADTTTLADAIQACYEADVELWMVDKRQGAEAAKSGIERNSKNMKTWTGLLRQLAALSVFTASVMCFNLSLAADPSRWSSNPLATAVSSILACASGVMFVLQLRDINRLQREMEIFRSYVRKYQELEIKATILSAAPVH